MTRPPVTRKRIEIAAKHIQNADIAAVACREAELPYFVACALLEKESGGRNVYGHDRDGALSGFPGQVNRGNYAVFRWMIANGWDSNGVGPCQITYPGFFDQMEDEGLSPWNVHHNMLFGFRLLKGYYDKHSSWATAGALYNGGPTPNRAALEYGNDLKRRIGVWKQRLGIS